MNERERLRDRVDELNERLDAVKDEKEPSDAPAWYSSQEASAWAAGWNAAREAVGHKC